MASAVDDAAAFMDAVLNLRRSPPQNFAAAIAAAATDPVARAIAVWGVCATLPTESPLYLAPFYDVDETRALLTTILKRLAFLPRKIRSDGGNIVLHGVGGVGKTTFLRATAIVCAVLHNEYVPVYWSYEKWAGKPALASDVLDTVIRAAASSIGVKDVDGGAFGANPRERLEATSPGAPVVLLLDDLSNVYDCDDRVIARDVISELVTLGKRAKHIVIVSGSTSELSERLFPSKDSEWGKRGFQTLNRSVFKLRRIYSIRTVDGVRAYLENRYPDLVERAAEVFRDTGGVGRAITDYANEGDLAAELRASLRDLLRREDYLLTLMARFACALPDSSLIPSLPWGEALSAAGAFHEPGRAKRSRLSRWEDTGVIVLRDGVVELLVPFHMDVVREELQADDLAVCLSGVRTISRGWEGHCGAGRS